MLSELAEGDYLYLDQARRIMAGHPFSATATPHTAQVTGGVTAYSMCTIDAMTRHQNATQASVTASPERSRSRHGEFPD